jgi:hypothetical protein
MFGLQDWRLSHRIGHRHATASTALKVLERNHALLTSKVVTLRASARNSGRRYVDGFILSTAWR